MHGFVQLALLKRQQTDNASWRSEDHNEHADQAAQYLCTKEYCPRHATPRLTTQTPKPSNHKFLLSVPHQFHTRKIVRVKTNRPLTTTAHVKNFVNLHFDVTQIQIWVSRICGDSGTTSRCRRHSTERSAEAVAREQWFPGNCCKRFCSLCTRTIRQGDSINCYKIWKST